MPADLRWLAATMADLLQVEEFGSGAVDVTVGSALDIFSGGGLVYSDLVKWNGRMA